MAGNPRNVGTDQPAPIGPTPSICRMVLYTDTHGRKFPAVITQVHNVTCVDLEIFGCYEAANRLQTSVAQGTSPGCWDWPPRT